MDTKAHLWLARDEAIQRIRKALKQRSGKTWSVKGGRGTAWGWIRITAPPARCNDYGEMEEDDRRELAQLLGLGQIGYQGTNVPDSTEYRWEYIYRAELGHPNGFEGKPYWD